MACQGLPLGKGPDGWRVREMELMVDYWQLGYMRELGNVSGARQYIYKRELWGAVVSAQQASGDDVVSRGGGLI